MARAIRLFALGIWRLFWVAVSIAFLVGLFTKVYPITDGFGRMFLDFIGILMVFVIFRLLSARRESNDHPNR